MRKLSGWLSRNLLKVGIGFLLLFVPLYPKLPLIDVSRTWVYIRLEDFFIALVVVIWLFRFVRRQISKPPLIFPFLFYWLVGGISLVFVLFALSSHLVSFHPHLAFLHFLRRIEYMVLFFVAASTIENLKVVKKYLLVMALSLLAVCLYGFGQKFFGLPAFLTMNEEFAKGLPLYLPPQARATSTFGGHYDLAAWLVLMIALFSSLIFALKRWSLRIGVLILVFLGFLLLLFTASRISFACYLAAISLVLLLQRKKFLVIPVIILSLLLMNYTEGVSGRLGKTLRVANVAYDAKTGQFVGVLQRQEDVGRVFTEEEEVAEEELPLGTGFLEMPVIQKTPPQKAEVVAIKRPTTTTLKTAKLSSEIATISGEFLIKRTIVYDVSFTTRLQGTWKRALTAFHQSPVLGTGYSSIELATDNSYLRALGETGLVGLFAFLFVFFSFGLLVKQGLDKINNPLGRSVLIGAISGTFGLALNAFLIDVFEASKVALPLWMILGIVAGTINFLVPKRRSLFKEAIEVLKWPISQVVILALVAVLLFYPALKNYFTGDDFTWLRWAAASQVADIPQFFVSAQGFFYRPLAKAYFTLIYPFLGLKPQGYHLVSFFLHFGCAVAAYFLALLLTRRKLVAFLTGLFFLICPIASETIFWISSTSALLGSFFYLWGFWAYLKWRKSQERRKWLFFFLSFLAFGLGLLSSERVVTFPLVILFYDFFFGKGLARKGWLAKLMSSFPFWLLTGVYFYWRTIAQAHGLSGDYNYNLKNLVFNFAGNLFGYLGELVAGFYFIPVYDLSRQFFRFHKLPAFFLLVLILVIAFQLIRRVRLNKVIIFSSGWFLLVLLPFLGLGNLAERHVYPAYFGFLLAFSFCLVGLFDKLKKKNRVLATFVFVLAVGVFASFYLREMQRAKNDWYQAGETANKILLAISSNYHQFPPKTTLYFVNLPLRQERAWIFPVGLEDAFWFIYQDESLRVEKSLGRQEAFELIEEKPESFVFLFEDGELKEMGLEIEAKQ